MHAVSGNQMRRFKMKGLFNELEKSRRMTPHWLVNQSHQERLKKLRPSILEQRRKRKEAIEIEV